MTSAHLQLRMSWPLFLLVENLSLQVLFHSRMPLLLLTCFHHPATHNLHMQQARHMRRPLNFDNRVSLLPSQLCTQMEVSPELHIHTALTRPGTNRYHSNNNSHLLQFIVVKAVLFHHVHGKLRQQRTAKQWGILMLNRCKIISCCQVVHMPYQCTTIS